MKKHYLLVSLILLIAFVGLFFYPEAQVSPYYEEKTNAAFSTIPKLTPDQKCLVEKYNEETYFIGGPSLGGRPYNPSFKVCGFLAKDSSVKALNKYKDLLVKDGWIYSEMPNQEKYRVEGTSKCITDEYRKDTFQLRVSNCPTNYFSIDQYDEWERLTGNNTRNGVGLYLTFRPTDEEISAISKVPRLIFAAKAILLVLTAIFLIKGLRRRKI